MWLQYDPERDQGYTFCCGTALITMLIIDMSLKKNTDKAN